MTHLLINFINILRQTFVYLNGSGNMNSCEKHNDRFASKEFLMATHKIKCGLFLGATHKIKCGQFLGALHKIKCG